MALPGAEPWRRKVYFDWIPRWYCQSAHCSKKCHICFPHVKLLLKFTHYHITSMSVTRNIVLNWLGHCSLRIPATAAGKIPGHFFHCNLFPPLLTYFLPLAWSYWRLWALLSVIAWTWLLAVGRGQATLTVAFVTAVKLFMPPECLSWRYKWPFGLGRQPCSFRMVQVYISPSKSQKSKDGRQENSCCASNCPGIWPGFM